MRPIRKIYFLFCAACATLAFPVHAEPEIDVDKLFSEVQKLIRESRFDEALAITTKAVKNSPNNPDPLFFRATVYEAMHQNADALADYDKVIALEPGVMPIYNRRGAVHFKLGQITESIADFDKAIELDPSEAPSHWQRGISLYYAGRYEDGKKQFELHRTVNPDDVENAVWHFLCVARAPGGGIDKARQSLIPITGDSRIPMKEIHELYAGKTSTEEVLAAARRGEPRPDQLNKRLFYAELYLGLYFEASSDTVHAREHITKAAREFKVDHYMGDVARVHAQLRGWHD